MYNLFLLKERMPRECNSKTAMEKRVVMKEMDRYLFDTLK